MRDSEVYELLYEKNRLRLQLNSCEEKSNDAETIKKRIVEINGTFRKHQINLRKYKLGCDPTKCNFVKNGFYKRGKQKVQNRICTFCGKAKAQSKIRNGIDTTTTSLLILLKLEGITARDIASLLNIGESNVNFYWREIKRKGLKTFSRWQPPVDHEIRIREVPIRFRLRSLYRAEIVANGLKIVIERVINERVLQDIYQIRILQAGLFRRPTHIVPYESTSFERTNKKVNRVKGLPNPDEKTIRIERTPTEEIQSEKKLTFSFSYNTTPHPQKYKHDELFKKTVIKYLRFF